MKRQLFGFSTLELLIACSLISTTVVSITLLTIQLPTALANGRRELGALTHANNLIEEAFITGAYDFPAVISIATTTVSIGTDYAKTSLDVVLGLDGQTKNLTATTQWYDSYGHEQFSVLSGLLTDTTIQNTSNLCASRLSGDWIHPYMYTLPKIFPSLSSLSIWRTTLAIAASHSPLKNDSTLFLYDISSSTAPVFITSTDNATSTKNGVASIALTGSQLYVANASTPSFSSCTTSAVCSQLQIFGVQTTSSSSATTSTLALVANYQLPTSTPPFATGSGGQSSGRSIFFLNGLVYLGLVKTNTTQGMEFNVIDVHLPNRPVWLGGISIGRTVNQIRVRQGYAYLATDDPRAELIVLDVHDPQNITRASTYDAPGSSTWGYGESLAIQPNNILALGRSYTPDGPELSILNMASATKPFLLSSEKLSSTTNPVGVTALGIQDFMTFALTDSALQLWDMTNPLNPQHYGDPLPLPTGSKGSSTAMTCKDNTLFIGANDLNNKGSLVIVTNS